MPRASRKSQRRKPPLQVLFVAGFGPIVPDGASSRSLYETALHIPFEESAGEYLHTGKLDGAKHFALWPLAQAARSCFGSADWPTDLPIPQAWVEFDVENVGSATAELKRKGYRLLVENRREPWGQTVSRLLSPEGLLIGITHTPWLRPSEGE